MLNNGYLNDPSAQSEVSEMELGQIQIDEKIKYHNHIDKIKGTKTLNHTDANHLLRQLKEFKEAANKNRLSNVIQEVREVQPEQDIDPQGNTN